MRLAVVVAASIGVGLVALAVVRLAGSIGQVQSLATSLPAISVGATAEATQERARPSETAATPPEPALARFGAATDAEGADESRGDDQIRRWLAADPELKRAADELSHDPDPDVRREAEQLLRELGVAASSGEP